MRSTARDPGFGTDSTSTMASTSVPATTLRQRRTCWSFAPGPNGRRVGSLYRWGLIPGWAKDGTMGAKLSNARAETVSEKPAFRAAFRRWRCIVPASGFFEWKAVQEDGRTVKQPLFHPPPGMKMNCSGFAGLSERWVSPGRRGNPLVLHHHDRRQRVDDADPRQDAGHLGSPAITTPWLDPANVNAEMLRALLSPCRGR